MVKVQELAEEALASQFGRGQAAWDAQTGFCIGYKALAERILEIIALNPYQQMTRSELAIRDMCVVDPGEDE